MQDHDDANGTIRTDGTREIDEVGSSTAPTRRAMLKATAGTGAIAFGAGAGFVGNVAGRIAAFEDLSVSSDNRIVDGSDGTFVMRGLSVPDPRRLAVTAPIRGKTAEQVVDLVTNDDEGWYPRVIRLPAQPIDVGGHPNGNSGPVWQSSELTNPDAIHTRDESGNITRLKKRPPQPPAFDESQLRSYLDNYYTPIVERCRERGVYCIVDYHRHWHEQPPGAREPGYAENHLPYESQYTNYWAYNTYSGSGVSFGTSAPASWRWVDMRYVNEGDHVYDGWAGIQDESDLPGTPYTYDSWQVNEALLDEVTTFWNVVAEEYADEQHVLFEPYNEPTAPGISGPVEGCGAVKQRPLWRTYQEDFAAPILDAIRTHAAEKLVLMGLPNWSRATQGLHWNDFGDLGYDDVAVTWHNYPGHEVSQVHNWLNDTSYRELSAVESETGRTLEDPFLPVATNCSADGAACCGWEAYEAQGLQNAMDFHPVVVTEFGWYHRNDRPEDLWINRYSAPPTTTREYGQPFLDALESDDRIGWVAWNADARWLPRMFDVTWEVEAGELPLTNDNWYETDVAAIPDGFKCPNELPCEWDLLGDPHSGQHVKERLAANAWNQVPFETDVLVGGGEPATDPDGDGLYEDVNGNGSQDLADVVDFFQHRDSNAVRDNVDAFDFGGNGSIDLADVVELFDENA